MSSGAIALTVLTGLLWAGLDAVRKGLAQRVEAVPLVAALTAVQVPLFGVWLMRSGAIALPSDYWPAGVASVVLNVASLLMFTHALAIAPISLTIPLLSLVPVFTSLAAIPMLGELPSLRQGFGILAVVVGALALGSGGDSGEAAARRSVLRGRLLMTGVSLLWAVTGPVDKLAVAHVAAELHALLISFGITLGIALYLASRRELAKVVEAFAQWRLLSLAALFGAGALGSQLIAIQWTLISLVEAGKRALGMAGSIVTGRLLFFEPISLRKVLCVAVMAAGVALVLL